MSVIARGTKNAFRNLVRSFSVTIILAISLGLALIMLLAMRAVGSRIDSVKGSIGNTITISPAGARGFGGGGEPLTTDDLNAVKATAHITKVTASINDRLDTIGATNPRGGEDQAPNAMTNLVSPITPGTLGRRFGGGNANFTLPIMLTGTNDPTSTQVAGSNQLNITSGTNIDGNSNQNVALVGKDLASKNNLTVGSTFTAYNQTIKVSGIFDAGNTFANAGIIMPLASVQNLSNQPNDVTNIIATTDSITNVSQAVSALQSKLGSKADVVSAQDSSNQALAPLENIKTISLYSLIGALVAGSVIIFLTMLMIVRERRREIGVLKAIGSSNIKIVIQFVIEALTLTLSGAVLGVITGGALSNQVLKILITSNMTVATPGGGRGFGRAFGRVGGAVNNLHTVVGYELLLYGLAAAVIIAVLGSAIPAWLIAKVRPAEVMRSE